MGSLRLFRNAGAIAALATLGVAACDAPTTPVVDRDIVGDELSDMLFPSRIYPADHAGLFAAFNLPKGLLARRRH